MPGISMAGRNPLALLLLTLLLSGCAHGFGKSLPYDAWHLGFLAPNYMEVWIETADAVDIHDRVYRRAMNGVAAIQTPPDNRGDPEGWPSATLMANGSPPQAVKVKGGEEDIKRPVLSGPQGCSACVNSLAGKSGVC